MNDSLMAEATEERVLVQTSQDRAVALTRPELQEVKGQAWFTHPSFSQNPKSSFEVDDGLLYEDYERLEFAGDKVIGWVVAEMIIEFYPKLTPGASTTLLSRLVCEETLSQFTLDYDLLNRLRASPAVIRTILTPIGARIRCDLFEAYIGAFYHSRGHAAARDWLRQLYTPLLHAEYDKLKQEHRPKPTPAGGISPGQAAVDFAELSAKFNDLSMRMKVAPTYQWTSDGPPHLPSFTCKIQFGDKEAVGTGNSKKSSKQAAVTALYGQLDTK